MPHSWANDSLTAVAWSVNRMIGMVGMIFFSSRAASSPFIFGIAKSRGSPDLVCTVWREKPPRHRHLLVRKVHSFLQLPRTCKAFGRLADCHQLEVWFSASGQRKAGAALDVPLDYSPYYNTAIGVAWCDKRPLRLLPWPSQNLRTKRYHTGNSVQSYLQYPAPSNSM